MKQTMDKEIQSIINNADILSKLADVVRLVDPMGKQVIEYLHNGTNVRQLRCYDFWEKHKICDNCISMRAYNDNSTYIKVEYLNDKIYMITAVPFELPDRRVVMELVKDTTDSMLFSVDKNPAVQSPDVYALIDRMNTLSFKDALTGIYNRRYINEKLPVDLLNTAMLSKQLCLIMADIDFFKNVNDRYGHLAGDAALKQFAQLLSTCIKRNSDWISRFGGEEFLICMPGASPEKAAEMAECMRKSVADTPIRYDGEEFFMTASFGVYNVTPGGGEDIDQLLKHTDEKLYQAKNNGRNRVES